MEGTSRLINIVMESGSVGTKNSTAPRHGGENRVSSGKEGNPTLSAHPTVSFQGASMMDWLTNSFQPKTPIWLCSKKIT